jgi:hypothetical protein
MTTYFSDVAALARKDLLLELRAKETLPAMLIFVISALTVFHFALPDGSNHTAALGLLWIAIVFTALLGLTRSGLPRRCRCSHSSHWPSSSRYPPSPRSSRA